LTIGDDEPELREEFIQHIREKYGDDIEFEIAEIIPRGDGFGFDRMYAYLRGGSQGTDGFLVLRISGDDGLRFADTLGSLLNRNEYEMWVQLLAEQYFEGVKVFSEATIYSIRSAPTPMGARDEHFTFLFVPSQFEQIESFEQAAKNFISVWEYERMINLEINLEAAEATGRWPLPIVHTVRVFYLENEEFEVLNRENFRSVIHQERYITTRMKSIYPKM